MPLEITWSFGGDVVADDGTIDFDTPEFAEAVDVYLGLYADGSVPTNGDFDQQQGFLHDQVAVRQQDPELRAAAHLRQAAFGLPA